MTQANRRMVMVGAVAGLLLAGCAGGPGRRAGVGVVNGTAPGVAACCQGRHGERAPGRVLEPLNVGTGRQLFIDDRFIARSHGVALTMNPAVKTPRVDSGPLLALPENRDVDFGGVFVDPPAPPAQRYKQVYLKGAMSAKDTTGLYIAYSADRKQWTEVPERVFPFYPDGENTMMYDPRLGKYVAYFRQWLPRSPGSYFDAPIKPLRTVGRLVVSEPLKPWPCPPTETPFFLWGPQNTPCPGPEFETVLACDADDPPECDFYDHAIIRYPWADDVYLAFPVLYRHFPDPPGKALNDGLCDIQLATSRDGVHWRRFRGSYVRLGLGGAVDGACIYDGRSLLRRGNDLLQYYSGYPRSHGSNAGAGGNPVFAGMVSQRLDGFVSADAEYSGGELTTPLVVHGGERLVLNLDTSAVGECRVEIQDAHGRPVPGYGLADADLLQGNDLDRVVTWGGRDDVAALKGMPVRLRFAMRAAKLYAFQFATRPAPSGSAAASP